MNTIYQRHEIEICADCLFYHANGDLPADGEWNPEDIDRNWPAEGDRFWTIVPGYGDEGGFSWAGCDSCGSTLGGDIYRATALQYGPTVYDADGKRIPVHPDCDWPPPPPSAEDIQAAFDAAQSPGPDARQCYAVEDGIARCGNAAEGCSNHNAAELLEELRDAASWDDCSWALSRSRVSG